MPTRLIFQGALGLIGLSFITLSVKLYVDTAIKEPPAGLVATPPYSYARLVEIERNKRKYGQYIAVVATGEGIPEASAIDSSNEKKAKTYKCLTEHSAPQFSLEWIVASDPLPQEANTLDSPTVTAQTDVFKHITVDGLSKSFRKKALPLWQAWTSPVYEIPSKSEMYAAAWQCAEWTEQDVSDNFVGVVASAAAKQQDRIVFDISGERTELFRTSAFQYTASISNAAADAFVAELDTMHSTGLSPWFLQELRSNLAGDESFQYHAHYAIPGPDLLLILIRKNGSNYHLKTGLIPKPDY